MESVDMCIHHTVSGQLEKTQRLDQNPWFGCSSLHSLSLLAVPSH